MKLKLSTIYAIAFIWAVIPIFQLLMFWFRWYYALPTIVIGLIGGYKIIGSLKITNSGYIPLNKPVIAVLIFIALWMLFVGIGGFVGQEQWDNAWRNAVLFELVKRPWPVVHETTEGVAYLSYYFSFWLPAAAIGKLFGSYDASQFGLFLYCYIGLSSAALMIMHYCNRRYLAVGVLIFLLAGADIFVSVPFRYILHWHADDYVGESIIGMPSLMYLCRFIYNQGVPAVVILMLMYTHRNQPGWLLMLYALVFSVAPFVALPITPILAYHLLKHLKSAISIENIFGLIVCVLVSVIFTSNTAIEDMKTIFTVNISLPKTIVFFLSWLIFNVAIFLPFIWNDVRNDKLFWWLLIFTIIFSIPVPSYGNYDFGWKVPIALWLLMLLKILTTVSKISRTLNLKAKMFFIVLAFGVLSNYNIFLRIPYSYYINIGRERASQFNDRLFLKAEDAPCYDNFVTDHETTYSKHFMPNYNQ